MMILFFSSRSLFSATRFITRPIITYGNRSTPRRNVTNYRQPPPKNIVPKQSNSNYSHFRAHRYSASINFDRYVSTSVPFSSSSSSTTPSSDMKYTSIVNQQPSNANWREAASLIILSKDDTSSSSSSPSSSPSPDTFDYKLLLVKRSGGSSFFASAYVFPGGQVEPFDFDLKWYQLFAKYGYDRQSLSSLSSDIVGPRPPIVTDSLTKRKHFPGDADGDKALHCDIGLRISAIRETFEEAGILLCVESRTNCSTAANDQNSNVAVKLSPENLTKWQIRVRNDASSFLEMCDTLGLVPNVWSLYEWSDWLTPVSVGHRRFDTLFYVCCLDKIPNVAVDNAEITKSVWCSPAEILEDNLQEKVFLAPPQVYEMSRLLPQDNLEQFRKFAKARQVLGTERWLPVLTTYDDGALSLIPGDPDYPQEPHLVSAGPVAEAPGTVDEAQARCTTAHNRIDIRGTQSRALCTMEPGFGHKAPIDFPSSKFHNRSKL